MTQFQKYFQKFQDIGNPSDKLVDLTVDVEKKASELVKIILSCSDMSFQDAFDKYGSEGMATMYELAQIRELLFNSKNKSSHQKILDRHLYQQCGEYLSVPPKDHPAYPNVILAKIDSITDAKEKNAVPSKTNFVVCNNLNPDSHGYITQFKEINGFMVPVIEGGILWAKYDSSQDTGFGTLIVNKSEHTNTDGKRYFTYNPLVNRPCSWTHFTGFHSNDGINYLGYTVIPREVIKGFFDNSNTSTTATISSSTTTANNNNNNSNNNNNNNNNKNNTRTSKK